MASNFQKKIKQQQQKSSNELLKDMEGNGVTDFIISPSEKIQKEEIIAPPIVEKETKNDIKLALNKKDEGKISIDTNNDVRTLITEKLEMGKSSISWNCRLQIEIIDRLEYTAYKQDTTFVELVNRIIVSEIKYEKEHPDMYTDEYVRTNLRNRRNKTGKKERKVFCLTEANKTFIEKSSKKSGMTQTAFIEFLIDEYCLK